MSHSANIRLHKIGNKWLREIIPHVYESDLLRMQDVTLGIIYFPMYISITQEDSQCWSLFQSYDASNTINSLVSLNIRLAKIQVN
jgi:hypothetical protein